MKFTSLLFLLMLLLATTWAQQPMTDDNDDMEDDNDAPATTVAPATTGAPATTSAPATTGAPATSNVPASSSAPSTTSAGPPGRSTNLATRRALRGLRRSVRRIRQLFRRGVRRLGLYFARPRTIRRRTVLRLRAQAAIARLNEYRQGLLRRYAQTPAASNQQAVGAVIQSVGNYANLASVQLNANIERLPASTRPQRAVLRVNRRQLRQSLRNIETIKRRVLRQIRQQIRATRRGYRSSTARFFRSMRRMIRRNGANACTCLAGEGTSSTCHNMRANLIRNSGFIVPPQLARDACALIQRVNAASRTQTATAVFMPVEPLSPSDNPDNIGEVIEDWEVIVIFILLAVLAAASALLFYHKRKQQTYVPLLTESEQKV